MTSMCFVAVTCPKCKHGWEIMIHLSICTWLNPEAINDFYNNGCQAECPKCKAFIPVHYDVLINCRRGMFILNTASKLYDLRYTFYDWGIIDFEGKVVNLGPSDG